MNSLLNDAVFFLLKLKKKKENEKRPLSVTRSSINLIIFPKRLALAMSVFLYNAMIVEKKTHKKWRRT